MTAIPNPMDSLLSPQTFLVLPVSAFNELFSPSYRNGASEGEEKNDATPYD